MKVSENTSETPTAPVAVAPEWPAHARAIAPWWHTVMLIAVIAAVSALGSFQLKGAGAVFHGGHIRRYAVTIAWEWVLALLAWWGLRMRRTPLREVLGVRRAGAKGGIRDLGAALLFWIIAMVLLSGIATLLRLFHLAPPVKALAALAPQGIAEILVWIALCCTAGMVEEFVFRGYMLQQFGSVRGSLWIGVIASSLVFGFAHGYEGLGGMLAIVAYGAMFCFLTMQRRSLRAGMIAHAWHDSFTGILLAIAKHSHLL
jgi:uncharacterized protein